MRGRQAGEVDSCRAIGEVTGATFVPFVVEATGQLGPAANKFFNEKLISRDGPYTARMFMQKMNFAIARWNGSANPNPNRYVLQFVLGTFALPEPA